MAGVSQAVGSFEVGEAARGNRVYANEWNPYAAEWLKNLSADIVDIDQRSICDVNPEDVDGYRQVHFFAGIGGWPLAAQMANWPWSLPLWTGSCPCQPFSGVGQGKGTSDERHLWPEMFRLIRECQPPIVVGEQVASGDGLRWLDGVFDDLEGAGYACGAADLPACGVGAPQIRQRIFWCGVRIAGAQPVIFSAECDEDGNCPVRGIDYSECPHPGPTEDGVFRFAHNGDEYGLRMEHAKTFGREARWPESVGGMPDSRRAPGGLVDLHLSGPQGHGWDGDSGDEPRRIIQGPDGHSPASMLWDRYEVATCRDGRSRRIESGTLPLAHGLPRSVGPDGSGSERMGLLAAKANRIGRIEGYGNAIVPQVGAMFLRAVLGSLFE